MEVEHLAVHAAILQYHRIVAQSTNRVLGFRFPDGNDVHVPAANASDI